MSNVEDVVREETNYHPLAGDQLILNAHEADPVSNISIQPTVEGVSFSKEDITLEIDHKTTHQEDTDSRIKEHDKCNVMPEVQINIPLSTERGDSPKPVSEQRIGDVPDNESKTQLETKTCEENRPHHESLDIYQEGFGQQVLTTIEPCPTTATSTSASTTSTASTSTTGTSSSTTSTTSLTNAVTKETSSVNALAAGCAPKTIDSSPLITTITVTKSSGPASKPVIIVKGKPKLPGNQQQKASCLPNLSAANSVSGTTSIGKIVCAVIPKTTTARTVTSLGTSGVAVPVQVSSLPRMLSNLPQGAIPVIRLSTPLNQVDLPSLASQLARAVQGSGSGTVQPSTTSGEDQKASPTHSDPTRKSPSVTVQVHQQHVESTTASDEVVVVHKTKTSTSSSGEDNRNHTTAPPVKPTSLNSIQLSTATTVRSLVDSSCSSFKSKGQAFQESKVRNKHGQIKRPMNAFMIWSRQVRVKVSKETQRLTNAEVSVKLGQMWNSMSDEEKKPFYEEADKLKRQHKMEHPDWVYRPQPRKREVYSSWQHILPPMGNILTAKPRTYTEARGPHRGTEPGVLVTEVHSEGRQSPILVEVPSKTPHITDQPLVIQRKRDSCTDLGSTVMPGKIFHAEPSETEVLKSPVIAGLPTVSLSPASATIKQVQVHCDAVQKATEEDGSVAIAGKSSNLVRSCAAVTEKNIVITTGPGTPIQNATVMNISKPFTVDLSGGPVAVAISPKGTVSAVTSSSQLAAASAVSIQPAGQSVAGHRSGSQSLTPRTESTSSCKAAVDTVRSEVVVVSGLQPRTSFGSTGTSESESIVVIDSPSASSGTSSGRESRGNISCLTGLPLPQLSKPTSLLRPPARFTPPRQYSYILATQVTEGSKNQNIPSRPGRPPSSSLRSLITVGSPLSVTSPRQSAASTPPQTPIRIIASQAHPSPPSLRPDFNQKKPSPILPRQVGQQQQPPPPWIVASSPTQLQPLAARLQSPPVASQSAVSSHLPATPAHVAVSPKPVEQPRARHPQPATITSRSEPISTQHRPQTASVTQVPPSLTVQLPATVQPEGSSPSLPGNTLKQLPTITSEPAGNTSSGVATTAAHCAAVCESGASATLLTLAAAGQPLTPRLPQNSIRFAVPVCHYSSFPGSVRLSSDTTLSSAVPLLTTSTQCHEASAQSGMHSGRPAVSTTQANGSSVTTMMTESSTTQISSSIANSSVSADIASAPASVHTLPTQPDQPKSNTPDTCITQSSSAKSNVRGSVSQTGPRSTVGTRTFYQPGSDRRGGSVSVPGATAGTSIPILMIGSSADNTGQGSKQGITYVQSQVPPQSRVGYNQLGAAYAVPRVGVSGRTLYGNPEWWQLPFNPYPLDDYYVQMARQANALALPFPEVYDDKSQGAAENTKGGQEEIRLYGDLTCWQECGDPYNPAFFTYGEPRYNIPSLRMSRWNRYMNQPVDVRRGSSKPNQSFDAFLPSPAERQQSQQQPPQFPRQQSRPSPRMHPASLTEAPPDGSEGHCTCNDRSDIEGAGTTSPFSTSQAVAPACLPPRKRARHQ